MKFSDEKWRELISLMELRVHIREAFKKVIKAEEKAALSQLIRRGLPSHQRRKQRNWLCIRESHLSSANAMFSLYQMSQSSTIFNFGYWSKHSPWICQHSKSEQLDIVHSISSVKKDTTFSSLILRKAVLQFLSLHNDNIRHAATKMATLSVSSGDKTSAENLEEQLRSKIKYFKKQALEDIELEE